MKIYICFKDGTKQVIENVTEFKMYPHLFELVTYHIDNSGMTVHTITDANMIKEFKVIYE